MLQTEIEAKFLHVSHDEIRERLMQLKAECMQPRQLLKRKNFDYPDRSLEKRGGWVRLRDEGGKITLSYKQLNHRGLDGTKEICLTVEDFNNTATFLEAIGLKQKSYQETWRESWSLDGVEVDLDEWPWINPFVEIEAPSKTSLFAVIDSLNLKKSDALYGSVEVAYQAEYDLSEEFIDRWPLYTFDKVPPEFLAKRRQE